MGVVTADGTLRTVTADSDPELFWAMRGCKGNFGIVTAIEFALVPQTRMYAGGLHFAGEYLAELLHAWRSWVPALPDHVTSSIAIQRLPELPNCRSRFAVRSRSTCASSPWATRKRGSAC
jgi:FAD/FMN-containing dehydrogenase